jgi:hypothetical protein
MVRIDIEQMGEIDSCADFDNAFNLVVTSACIPDVTAFATIWATYCTPAAGAAVSKKTENFWAASGVFVLTFTTPTSPLAVIARAAPPAAGTMDRVTNTESFVSGVRVYSTLPLQDQRTRP